VFAPAAAKRAHAAAASSGGQVLAGLRRAAETGQAMMLAMIALGAMGLLALLFSDELQLVLSRLIQRPPPS
jgi:hypothetical protein